MTDRRRFLGCVGGLALARALPAAPVPKPAEKFTPFVEWRTAPDPAVDRLNDPLLIGDRVFAGTDGGDLRAFDRRTGRLLWTHAHGRRVYLPPCGDEARVYVSSEAGLTAVTADAGREVWAVAIPTGGAGPAVVGPAARLVLTCGNDGNAYALNAATGTVKWTADLVADAPQDPPGFAGKSARGNGKARPGGVSCDGETAFFSVADQCRVVALDLATGKRRWAFRSAGFMFGAAAFDGDRVYVGSQDKSIHGLDKRTGRAVWAAAAGGFADRRCLADGVAVYFATDGGRLSSVNKSDGTLRWQTVTAPVVPGTRSALTSGPVPVGSYLGVTGWNGKVYGVARATGRLEWVLRPVEGAVASGPASDGTTLVLATQSGPDEKPNDSLVAVALQ